MSPPIQYTSEIIAKALRAACSFKQAAEFVGMSMGAMRKRALRDRELRPLALKCLARGKARYGWRRTR